MTPLYTLIEGTVTLVIGLSILNALKSTMRSHLLYFCRSFHNILAAGGFHSYNIPHITLKKNINKLVSHEHNIYRRYEDVSRCCRYK